MLFFAASKAVDRALFVAGRAVFLLLGDGGEIGGMVFRRHGNRPKEEAGEGGMAVEDSPAL